MPKENGAQIRPDLRPLLISAPEPRSLDLIFTAAQREVLISTYRIIECSAEELPNLPEVALAEARYIVGQPALDEAAIAKMKSLRCIFNVESNLINNMPYDALFSRGIHVLTTGAVFAEPVAEIGLCFALNLARGVIDADQDFRAGREKWGGEGNGEATLLSGADVGIIGFGEVGRSLNRLLVGFRCNVRAYDPWLPKSQLQAAGVRPASLDEVLGCSDYVFVLAAVTSENQGFLNKDAFAQMRRGAALILLSRADVVNFDDLMEAARSGQLRVASDVFPQEPMPADHPVRSLEGFILSAHRAGAMDVAFKRMGDMVLEDMALIDKNLPPAVCKRAERETVNRMRSRPVSVN